MNFKAEFTAAYSAARKSMQGNTVYAVSRILGDDGRVYFDMRTAKLVATPIRETMCQDLMQVMGMKYAKPIPSVAERFAARAADADWAEADDDYVDD